MAGVNSKNQPHKHVSRACLECRSRHLKCDGHEPVCERCQKHNRVCTYVKSHRGGSRKKGVSLKNKLKSLVQQTHNNINEVDDTDDTNFDDDDFDDDGDDNNNNNNANINDLSNKIELPEDNNHIHNQEGQNEDKHDHDHDYNMMNNENNGFATNYNRIQPKMNEVYSYESTNTEETAATAATAATGPISNSNTVVTTPVDDPDNNLKKKSKSKSKSKSKTRQSRNHKSDILPCVKNGMGHLADSSTCTEACLNVENYNKVPPCIKLSMEDSNDGQSHPKKINYHPLFNGSKDDDPINLIFDDTKLAPSLDQCYISPALINNLNIDSIISSFYNFFYTSHPFLPPKEHIMTYLDAIPYKYDLLLAMKIMGEGQTTSKYARDIETVNFLVISILKYIRQVGKDFISLQSLLLLGMISHISSLHDLSGAIREASISLALEMRLNFIDESNVPSVFLDVNGFITERDDSHQVNAHMLNTPSDSDSKSSLDSLFNSKRVLDIPREILIETMRKTFWELYYFDSISGTASGHTKSRLAIQHCLVLYPRSIPLNVFDYKSRAEACKLVNDAISLNIAIQTSTDNLPHLNHMRAALGNWEMKLSNPETYGMPYLINQYGNVNDGVFEAIMLLNYAGIFTHRPFSYLWRADVSKHPRCTDEKGIDDPCEPLENKESQNSTDSRKIIETRKTIDSANFFMKTLLDTDPGQTCKRTPFLACALAFSCLVHLSSFAWVETNLPILEATDNSNQQITASELDTYTEYIKLEIGSILQIARHWSLSAKLITHISETLARVSPKLFRKVQTEILGLGYNIAGSTSPSQNSVPTVTPVQNVSMANSSSAGSLKQTPQNVINNNNDIPDSRFYTTNIPNYMKIDDQQQQQQQQQHQQQNQVQLNDYNTQLFNYQNQQQLNNVQRQQRQQQQQIQSNQTLFTNQPSLFNNNNRSNNNSNNNEMGNSNNFMLEFTDLVGSLNGLNQGNSNDLNSGPGAFPSDNQDYGFLDPLSPSSDTGCDWVDRNDFQFDAFAL